MKIVADENMREVVETFAPYGEVTTLAGRDINPAALRDADILLVRSVTRVDEDLLRGSGVKFVGSATIGTDHIDQAYLEAANIYFAHAPGCNAEAVVQYMFAVFCTLEPQWRSKSVGIIGCGNVGGRLFRRLSALGVNCKVYDPYLDDSQIGIVEYPESALLESAQGDLETALGADIVCLHVPLVRGGDFPTHHMINNDVLERCIRSEALLINASRGAVIDNGALLGFLREGRDVRVALDVWEGEPDIDLALLEQVDLATPHIAGYSWEGRLRGTLLVRNALCHWLGVALPDEEIDTLSKSLAFSSEWGVDGAILATYSVVEDDRNMRMALGGGGTVGAAFDNLRKHYAQRREFSHYSVTGVVDELCRAELALLGFIVH